MTGLFAGYLHPYYTYSISGLFTGYLHPITHIHDRSLYRLFAFLIHIYMTGLCTGYLHYITHIHDWSCICELGMQITSKGTAHVYV